MIGFHAIIVYKSPKSCYHCSHVRRPTAQRARLIQPTINSVNTTNVSMAFFGVAQPAHSGEAMVPLQCVECRRILAQQRYVLHERQPYCIHCYETKFANVCHACSRVIATDSRVHNIYRSAVFFL